MRGLDRSIGRRSGNRGLRQNDWYVVRNARMPAVLTEVGFVSNPEEAARLADAVVLERRGAGHVQWRERIHLGIRTKRECRCSIDSISFCGCGSGDDRRILGMAFLGVLVLSLLLFLFFGNGKAGAPAVLSLADRAESWRSSASCRAIGPLEENVAELADSVLLGPTRHDALRLFPRGGTVLSAVIHGRTLYLDLTPQPACDDPEVPLKGAEALRRAGAIAAIQLSRRFARWFFSSTGSCRASRKRKIFDKACPVAIIETVTPEGSSSERSDA